MFTYNSYMFKVSPTKKKDDRAIISKNSANYNSTASVGGKAAKVLGFKHPRDFHVCYMVS